MTTIRIDNEDLVGIPAKAGDAAKAALRETEAYKLRKKKRAEAAKEQEEQRAAARKIEIDQEQARLRAEFYARRGETPPEPYG